MRAPRTAEVWLQRDGESISAEAEDPARTGVGCVASHGDVADSLRAERVVH